MTLFEYSPRDGLKEILDFQWDSPAGEPLDRIAFERLGYRDQQLGLYSENFCYWIDTYKNIGNNEYEFLLCVNNHVYGQYVVCRTFAEYMDFMKQYLPVIRHMNDIALQTASITK